MAYSVTVSAAALMMPALYQGLADGTELVAAAHQARRRLFDDRPAGRFSTRTWTWPTGCCRWCSGSAPSAYTPGRCPPRRRRRAFADFPGDLSAVLTEADLVVDYDFVPVDLALRAAVDRVSYFAATEAVWAFGDPEHTSFTLTRFACGLADVISQNDDVPLRQLVSEWATEVYDLDAIDALVRRCAANPVAVAVQFVGDSPGAVGPGNRRVGDDRGTSQFAIGRWRKDLEPSESSSGRGRPSAATGGTP